MTIPAPTFPEVRVWLERSFAVYYLADSDGVALVDTDGSRLAFGAVTLPIEITDRVLSGSLDLGDVQAVGSSHAGVDATVQVLSLSLDGGEPSLIPGARSLLNEPDDLLRAYRRIIVWASADRTVDGAQRFSGYLGDELRSVMSADRTTITLRARDGAKPLQDMFIADWPVIAADATPETPINVEDVFREIIDLLPVGRKIGFTATPTPFYVRYPYRPHNQSLWDAAQQLALQAGGVLRFLGSGVLHFTLPPRPIELFTTPPEEYRFTPDQVFIDDLGRTDTDIRNVVTVAYRDRDTGERMTVSARDQWSVDNLTGGIDKASIIEVDATSQIDTAAEAQLLADRFVNDMSREFVSTQLTLPFMPQMQLFTIIEVANPRVGYAPRRFAVHSIRHTWAGAVYRTIVAGVSQVVGRRRSWLDLEPRAGSPNDPRGPHQSVLPAPEFSLFRDFAGFAVLIEEEGVSVDHYEIHWSTTPSFVPSAATLRAVVGSGSHTFRNFLDPAAPDFITTATHYVRVRAVDERGHVGPFSAEQSVLPGILAVLLPGEGDAPLLPDGGGDV